MTAKKEKPKRKRMLNLQFSANEPFRISFNSSAELRRFESNQSKSKIKKGMEQYLARIQELTTLNVPEPLRKSLPQHFHSFTRAFVGICEDGIVIRYEPVSPTAANEVVVIGLGKKLREIVPLMSMGLICIACEGKVDPLPDGITPPSFSLAAFNAAGEQIQTFIDGAAAQLIFPMPSEKHLL